MHKIGVVECTRMYSEYLYGVCSMHHYALRVLTAVLPGRTDGLPRAFALYPVRSLSAVGSVVEQSQNTTVLRTIYPVHVKSMKDKHSIDN